MTKNEIGYKTLEQTIYQSAKINELTPLEKERLLSELAVVKKIAAAHAYLYAIYAVKGFDKEEFCFLGKENNSIINYVLGLTAVNPVKYGLPFELFFNSKRCGYMSFCFYIKSDAEDKLYENLGKMCIDENLSNICFVDEDSDDMLGCMGMFSEITFSKNTVAYKNFIDDEVYKKTLQLYGEQLNNVEEFTNFAPIGDILKSTEGKLVFQEQVIEILNKLCGFDLMTADCARKAICTKKLTYNDEVESILTDKYGEVGKELFKYLLRFGIYTVSKGSVVSRLYNNVQGVDIKYKLENGF